MMLRNAIGTMLLLAGLAPLSAHAAAPVQQVVIGTHHQTHASQTLQNDVLATAHNAVPVLVTHVTKNPQLIACGRMELSDTVVTKLVPAGPWTEMWTWKVCQSVLSVPINFVPDGKGGTNYSFDVPHATVRPASATD